MKYVLLACLSIFLPLLSQPKNMHRELIILLDYAQSEDSFKTAQSAQYVQLNQNSKPTLGAITFSLLPALYQKAAPILVSKCLLKNILKHKAIFKEFIAKDSSFLRQKYGETCLFSRSYSLDTFKKHCLYAQKMYKQVNSDLKHIFKNGTTEEVETALDTLTASVDYSEAAAPPTLRFYANYQREHEALHREIEAYLLCANAPLNKKSYIIKEVSSELILLVPRSYARKTWVGSPRFDSSIHYLTLLEKKLGLKLNHLPDVVDLNTLLEDQPPIYTPDLISALRKILITRAELPSAETHAWTLYVGGHGLPLFHESVIIEQLKRLKKYYESRLQKLTNPQENSATAAASNSLRETEEKLKLIEQKLNRTKKILTALPPQYEKIICSMPLHEFKELLDFCNIFIKTELLFYTSCYAGGDHLVIPYLKNNKERTFNYDIIVSGVADAVTFQESSLLLIPPYRSSLKNGSQYVQGITRDSFDIKKKALQMRTTLRFDSFFKSLRKADTNAHHATSLLHPYTDKQGVFIERNIENIAHIRKAGTTSFKPLAATPSFAVISDNPGKHILKDEKIVFLTAPSAPQMNLDRRAPLFISLLPGKAAHVIEKIVARKIKFADLIDGFLALTTLNSAKLFWIKELECLPDEKLPALYKSQKKALLTNVIVVRNVYCTDNLKAGANTGLYMTDTTGNCWYAPLNAETQNGSRAHKVSFPEIAAELQALFPNLKALATPKTR